MKHYNKDPDALLDYAIDWSQWLESGETIQTSQWIVPVGMAQDSATLVGAVATIWLSGGVLGAVHRVVNRVTTSASRVRDYTLVFHIEEE